MQTKIKFSIYIFFDISFLDILSNCRVQFWLSRLYVPVYRGSFQLLRLAFLRGWTVWSEHWTHLRCPVLTGLFLMASAGHILERPRMNRGRYDYQRGASTKGKGKEDTQCFTLHLEKIVWLCNINTIFLHFCEMRVSQCSAEDLETRLSAVSGLNELYSEPGLSTFLPTIVHIQFDPTKVVVCLRHWYFSFFQKLLSIYSEHNFWSVIWENCTQPVWN